MSNATKLSQTARVLNLLKANGKATNSELNKISFRYGGRLFELRKEGHVILTNRISEGLYEYIYQGTR